MSRKKKETELIAYRLESRLNGHGKTEYKIISVRVKPYTNARGVPEPRYYIMLERAGLYGGEGDTIYIDDSVYSLDPEKLKVNCLRRLTADANHYLQALATNREQFNQLKALKPEA